MDLQRGVPLLYQQYRALLKKNLLLSWRNKRATFFQLFTSFFFIFLIFCLEKSNNSRNPSSTSFKDIRDPKPLALPPIPPCENKYYIRRPCFDFVWSGNESQTISKIVRAIRENNPGRPIPKSKVKSFGTVNEVDEWLSRNLARVSVALHFIERNATVISYGLQTNSTPEIRGRHENPTLKLQLPFQIAAEREIARSLIGDAKFSWNVELKEFPHPAIEEEKLSVLPIAGPTFFLAIAMFSFVFQIGSLVLEKELKLRQAMATMGLLDSAYWFSWLTWEGMMAFLSSLLILLFGMMFQFDFFLNNNFAVIFLVYFLFQLNMVGYAFMLSPFISKSSSTTVIGFSIFIIGFFTQMVTGFGFPYGAHSNHAIRGIWSLFPPNLFAQALKLLSGATSTPQDVGISWSGRTKCAPNDYDCVITINDIYKWLVATFFLWVILAIYLDNVIPNTFGVRKSVFYFLQPGYWIGKGEKVEEGGICSCMDRVPAILHSIPDDEDVLEEENLVKAQTKEGAVDPNIAVQIRGLAKTYPASRKIACCFQCKKTLAYHAVKGLWVNLAKDQLFCLLGPNGAGKTTAINCLTGITPVSSGDALIYGYSIRSSIGMSNIRRTIGFCPQFDTLWNALSGLEHLELFSSIKGLPPASIKSVVEKSLADVRLTEASQVRAESYSGGMRRRLSVAVALIGDPKLVILDEPTSGMDPITRRHVWDIIESAKKGRAIVLTTHSMEEADILNDRIGIMAKGRLHCIGTSIRLKSRFGTGFIANISFVGSNNGIDPSNGDVVAASDHHKSVKQFFKNHLDVVPKEENKAFLTFVIPHDREKLLTELFTKLQDRQREFGISDIQLSLTTLEEVFLDIARRAELESARVERQLVTHTLTSGASLQIPVGARFVGIPGTESVENPRGVMVEIYWEQDDSGRLCISGHSSEIPLPPNFQPMASLQDTNRKSLDERGPIHGIVINPEQIITTDH